jgi:hypothetical protein
LYSTKNQTNTNLDTIINSSSESAEAILKNPEPLIQEETVTTIDETITSVIVPTEETVVTEKNNGIYENIFQEKD